MNETVRIGNLSITVDSIEYLQGIYSGLMLAMEAITNTDITNEAYKEILRTMRYVDDLLNGIPKLKYVKTNGYCALTLHEKFCK